VDTTEFSSMFAPRDPVGAPQGGATPRHADRMDLDVLRVERTATPAPTPTATPAPTPPGGWRGPSALVTGPIPLAGTAPAGTSAWQSRFIGVLLVLDAVAFLLGGLLGRFLRADTVAGDVQGISYLGALAIAAPAWLVVLAASRAYERRCLGLGSEEFRRVGNAAARFTAVVAIVLFLVKADLARGLIVLALPAATAFALVFRYLARQGLHRVRADGRASHRVLVVGEGAARDALTAKLQANAYSGLRVVGVCRPALTDVRGGQSVDHVRGAVESLGADTVAVAHSEGLSPDVLRRIAWTLEGTGVDLLVAPALTDVAGPRIHVRPVSGLPLLQIAEPEFTGVRRLGKGTIDVVGAVVLLVLASPVLLAAALAVRTSSHGPVFFRQTRVGKHGEPFRMWKFRSMFVDAEERLAELRAHNDHGGGVLFKMRQDPRITRVGRVLRRYSIDELPQLFNVLGGRMSLVGPRPPLPTEVARYERDVHRRLLVKPGLTGLWQVSGRADLDWTETVRLDLYYVENWSVALDVEILWKTASAVLRGSGAR